MFPDLTRDDVFRIETRRLWLRWPCAKDADAIVRLAGDAAVAGMTARIPHPLDRRTVDGFILGARREAAEGRSLTMAVTARARPQTLIGIVGIDPDEEAAGPHLGYWLGTPHWGQGLATEAVGAMVEAYFAYTPGRVLISDIRTGNLASRRVLVKSGFSPDGTALRAFPARGDDAVPTERFRLDRRMWERRRADAAAALVAVHV